MARARFCTESTSGVTTLPVYWMAAAIAWASAMPTPDPGLKYACARNRSRRSPGDSTTTTPVPSNVWPDASSSLSSNPALSAASSGSVSRAECPERSTAILGTVPATAGLKLGAGEGRKVGKCVGSGVVGARLGAEVGAGEGLKVGKCVGSDVVGARLGAKVGAGEGLTVGKCVGSDVVGARLGAEVGAGEGLKVGKCVGSDVVGARLGAGVGAGEGLKVGKCVGSDVVGARLGDVVGAAVGVRLGAGVGAAVGPDEVGACVGILVGGGVSNSRSANSISYCVVPSTSHSTVSSSWRISIKSSAVDSSPPNPGRNHTSAFIGL